MEKKMLNESLAALLRPLLGPALDHIEITQTNTNFGNSRSDMLGVSSVHTRGRTRYTIKGWLRDSAFADAHCNVLPVVTDMLTRHGGTLTFDDYAIAQRTPRVEFKMTVHADSQPWKDPTPLADAAFPEVCAQVRDGELTADEGAAAMNTLGRMEPSAPGSDTMTTKDVDILSAGLDSMAASLYNLHRHPGESDTAFRSRIADSLFVDGPGGSE